jgi:hypothetical protein
VRRETIPSEQAHCRQQEAPSPSHPVPPCQHRAHRYPALRPTLQPDTGLPLPPEFPGHPGHPATGNRGQPADRVPSEQEHR